MTADKERTATVARNANGTFAAGNSGRPHGTRNKRTIEALRKIQAMDDAAMTALLAAATRGESWAVTYILDHVVPKGRVIEVDNLSAHEIAELAREGVLTTGELKDLSATIAKLRAIDDIDELRAKLAELERYVKQ